MFRSDRMADMAHYSAFYNLRTSSGSGFNEIFVDSIQIPRDSFGIVMSLNQGHPAVLNRNIGAFLCDETMTNGFNPLLPNGALDPNKIGPGCMFLGGANIQNVNFLLPDFIIVPPNWFVRFATYLGVGNFPFLNDFTSLRLQLAVIPLCEDVC